MNWIGIASIVFTCVTANHLGLVKAVEKTFDRELPIVNCVKCSTFWFCLFYLICTTHAIITSLAISFLSSYIAIWLELLEGFVDTLYMKVYEKIYSTTNDDTSAADADDYSAADTMP